MDTGVTIGGGRGQALASAVFAVLIALLAAPFALQAFGEGWTGVSDRTGDFGDRSTPPSWAIYLHMSAGGVLTLFAPLQLLPFVRRLWPGMHHLIGYGVFASAICAAIGGLVFISGAGTVGGWRMDAAFAGYGICLGIAAMQTVRLARARDLRRHRDWALRLFVLAIGSWLYRVQYGLWELTTGGIWRAPDFSGLFDQIQLLAFYVPWLIGLEIWFRIRDRRTVVQSAPE